MLINTQVDSEEVTNPYGLPSVTTGDVVMVARIDKSIGTPRISEFVMHAYDVIDGQLKNKPRAEHCHCAQAHHHALTACAIKDLLATIGTDARLTRIYKRAVIHEAAALFADIYLDYDTTTAGLTRAENEATKSDALRRIVSHCIADLKGKPRNRIRLQ